MTTTVPEAPSIKELVRRYASERDEPADLTTTSLSAALAGVAESRSILGYLAGIGLHVTTISDLRRINDLEGEEELAAFEVAEGVAVSVASANAWILFTP